MRGLALDLWDEASGELLAKRGAPAWGLGDPQSAPPWGAEENIRPIRTYLECRSALTHPQMASQIDNRSLRQSDSNLVFLDGRRHKRLRSVLNRVLPDPRAATASSNRFVEGLLEGLPAYAQIDIVGDFAVPIAQDMALNVLGLPRNDHSHMASLLSSMSVQFDPASDHAALADATDAVGEFLSCIRLAVRRRAYSSGGGLDQLNRARIAGELTLREMLGSSMLLAHASFQNSVNALSFAAVESLTNPLVNNVMKTAGPTRQGQCIEELLRLGSPARLLGRRAHEETTIGSTPIAEEDLVILFLGEANRDPTVFDRPDHFDDSGNRKGHLALGAGTHLCLGAALARGELRSAIRGLTNKYATLTFDSVTWGTNMVMFGPTSLVVELGA